MKEITSDLITPDLVAALRAAQPLHWHGIHGVTHWLRVRENGLRLAAETGADLVVVEYFAFLHDIKRYNDGHDPEHGARAALYARTIRDTLLRVNQAQFDQLIYACAHHTHEARHSDVTICTCWDADRLDLARVGIIPDPRRLCTQAARDPAVRRWAVRRSQAPLDP